MCEFASVLCVCLLFVNMSEKITSENEKKKNSRNLLLPYCFVTRSSFRPGTWCMTKPYTFVMCIFQTKCWFTSMVVSRLRLAPVPDRRQHWTAREWCCMFRIGWRYSLLIKCKFKIAFLPSSPQRIASQLVCMRLGVNLRPLALSTPSPLSSFSHAKTMTFKEHESKWNAMET